MTKPLRVVIVDDSPTMRGLIAAVLRAEDDISVVGTAGDPYEARDVIKATSPDVITLDVEMPRMDGLSFLEKIMRLRPMPVIMVSTLTKRGADISIEALQIGAFECIAKPVDGEARSSLLRLPDLLRTAAQSNRRYAPVKAINPAAASGPVSIQPNRNVIAIGSSTGGVEALMTVLASFPAKCPPTVITQHMPENFTASFAARLDSSIEPSVSEATDGAPLEIGKVYLAPGGAAHLEVARSGGLICRLSPREAVNGHRPSVDVLFDSVAKACGSDAVGAILTGMGRDGAKGLKSMLTSGARTVGQDEQSCVVYGMPRAAFEIGAVEKQLNLDEIGPAILSLCDERRGADAA